MNGHHSTLIDWVGALIIVLLFAMAVRLDKHDETLEKMHAQYPDVQRAELARARQLDERAYLARVARTCGPEAWFKPSADGARVCTDKHGRPSGQLLAGANP